MRLYIPTDLHAFELTATIQIVQALQREGQEVVVGVGSQNDGAMLALAGINSDSGGGPVLEYGKAHRAVENTDRWYTQLLNECSGSLTSSPLLPIQFPGITPASEQVILMAPFGQKKLEISITHWRLMAKFLRTYNLPVKSLGQPGQRIDLAGFTEADILTDCPIEEKLATIASAVLMVGIPNEWLEAAVGWNRPLVVLYPEAIRPMQWFPYLNDHSPFRLMAYPKNNLDAAAIITGLRHLIKGIQ